MKIEVVSERANPLLKRREVKFSVSYAGATPSRKDIREELVKLLHAKAELLVLDRVDNEFGKNSAKGYAKVYENKEAMGVEPLHKLKRNLLVADEKKAEAAAPAPAEEKK
ncbi:30S ribosomal protein S24e [uncultured archaeon]|nr:30S ribosomal protein S24e [uncultured archaeon]